MPEIPLSVGSKLELLLSLPNFRILPRTLTHLSAYAYCVYITMYMTEAPRVLHFSAFINPRRACAGGLRYLSCLSVCLFVCLSVCLSVCYHLIVDIVRFYGLPKVRAALF